MPKHRAYLRSCGLLYENFAYEGRQKIRAEAWKFTAWSKKISVKSDSGRTQYTIEQRISLVLRPVSTVWETEIIWKKQSLRLRSWMSTVFKAKTRSISYVTWVNRILSCYVTWKTPKEFHPNQVAVTPNSLFGDLATRFKNSLPDYVPGSQ